LSAVSRVPRVAALAGAVIALAMACAQQSTPEGAAGGAAPSVASDGFALSIQPFLNVNCACHQSEPLMASFSLKPAVAYQNLVDAPSLQLPAMARVRPGSLNDSYLWHKLSGTHLEVGGSGEIMPSNVPLNDEERDLFARWIAAGAAP
jgi:hypothetical protein